MIVQNYRGLVLALWRSQRRDPVGLSSLWPLHQHSLLLWGLFLEMTPGRIWGTRIP